MLFGVLRRILRALIALPRPLRRMLAGPPVRQDGQTLDLDVQVVLRTLGLIAGGEEPSLVEQRRATDRAAGLAWSATPGVTTLPVRLPVPAGPGRDEPGELVARLYTPAEIGDRDAPLLVHFHGGGFALGSIASSEPLCRVLANQASVRVLSVEYRLAPENPFPAGLADAAAALHHVLTHRDEFRATTVAAGGDSAGANLALTAAHQLARHRDETAAFVLALYPVTDAGRVGGSRELFGEGFGLRTADIEVFERYYLPDGIEPIRPTGLLEVGDLAIMPPCYVSTAGFDPLRDEGEELVAALRDVDVPVVARRFPGLIHGYAGMAGVVPAARDAVLDAASALRAGLALTTKEAAAM
ncbi:alpha/beta hydrolase [Actinomycetospora lutea]|uniref:alpha/beta hydrolase n=1 Tax=Actinomycetospora lutea TaxID=663604 RepID=UPI00236682FC|nr:alpha/beta hydrolase [Actinomycetospora lutea]MDD7940149.1 alpha/beta hydrolase [Actinomycetospora lutea]